MSAGEDQPQDLLARAVRALSSATTAAQVGSALAAVVVPALADWCLVDGLQPPDLITRLAAVGRDGPLDLPPELGPVSARRSSARAGGLLTLLVDAPGQRLVVPAERIRALTGSDDRRLRYQAGLAESLGTTEAVVLGLSSADELLGALTAGRTRGPFDAGALTVLADLAVLAGTVLSSLRRHELQRGVSEAVQRTLLPALPAVPGLALAARFAPAVKGLAVGGDWYDVFRLPDGVLALVVGDATGHDVLASARMAELRNLLRAVAVDQQDPPARTLSRLDRVADALTPGLTGTCLYAQLHVGPTGRELRWSSAGHLPPVLLRGGTAVLLDTEPDLMLGVRCGTDRSDHVLALEDGDLLVLYTDGLVEERRTGLDERLEALRRRVEALGPDRLEQLADRLVHELASGEDDVAVLVVQVEPVPGRATGQSST